MPCSTNSGLPMFGCCGPAGGVAGQRQLISVTKIIPDPPVDVVYRFSDIDGFLAQVASILDAEPFPGIWSSITGLTIDRSGTLVRSFSGQFPGTVDSVPAQATVDLLHLNAPGGPDPFPPPRGQEKIVQDFGGSSFVRMSKARYLTNAPWSSYLDRGPGEAPGTKHECVYQVAPGLYELEATSSDLFTSSMGMSWTATIVRGNRTRWLTGSLMSQPQC